MNSCEWTSRLNAFHDGELSPADEAALEGHLVDCAICQRELRDYRRLSLMLGRMDIPELNVNAVGRIKQKIRGEGNVFIFRLARRMTGVAAAVLVAASIWLVSASSADTTPSQVHDWEAAAVSPSVDTGQQNTGDVQLAEWIETDLSR